MSDRPTGLSDEDLKLLTLARAARARISASEGAAVRDETGRTYASASVALPSLELTALQVCVAQAVAAGARGVEAAFVVTERASANHPGIDAVRDLGGDNVPIVLANVVTDEISRTST
jgi:hypothetical protein